MRKIKFRAWDKVKKEMVSHDKLFRLDCSNEFPFIPLLENGYADRGPFTFDVEIMQCTGLKDRNGVDIYEGDIIRTAWPDLLSVVTWDDECARFIGFTIEHERRIVYVGMVDKNNKSAVEIVGNIYENAKLLNDHSAQ